MLRDEREPVERPDAEPRRRPHTGAVALSDLQKKMPVTDALLQGVLGDKAVTLADAMANHRLYVVDYTTFEGWQVLDGLSEGERIVTSGNLMIDAQAQFNNP